MPFTTKTNITATFKNHMVKLIYKFDLTLRFQAKRECNNTDSLIAAKMIQQQKGLHFHAQLSLLSVTGTVSTVHKRPQAAAARSLLWQRCDTPTRALLAAATGYTHPHFFTKHRHTIKHSYFLFQQFVHSINLKN